LALPLTTAAADANTSDPGHSDVPRLGGLPLPDLPIDSRAAREAIRSTALVCPGDSLWSISASLLTGASDEEVAAAWPELWQANRQTLGDDPSLIRPGNVLVIPEGLQR